MSCRLCGRDDCDRSCNTPPTPEVAIEEAPAGRIPRGVVGRIDTANGCLWLTNPEDAAYFEAGDSLITTLDYVPIEEPSE